MKNIDNFQELIDLAQNKRRFSEVFQELESSMLEKEICDLRKTMLDHLENMKAAIKRGLENPQLSESEMSGMDSYKLSQRFSSAENLAGNQLFCKIMRYAIATMEENQRMGRVVACPTAGSCGVVPAVLTAYSEEFDIDVEKQVDAMFTAGGIGKIIAQRMPLAGAVAGCQAEGGVASAMAAAAVTEMLGGTNSMVINSAALALKNIMGLACDPIAGLVEVPCIKRNAFLGIHAVTASEMALAGVESFVPIDEIVGAMIQVGNLMSPLIKETGEGGLASTKTALNLNKRLKDLWIY
jgi:L-serine dehydratase